MLIRVAEGSDGDLFNTGETLGVNFAHSPAADDSYLDLFRHCHSLFVLEEKQ
jgi:hypothetical protein